MSRNYGRPDADKRLDIFAWADVVDQQNEDFLAIARHPATLELVESRIKKSIGRTPDIPVKCGPHPTGYFVALAIEDGHASLLYLRAPGRNDTPTGRVLTGTLAPDLRVACPVCDRATERNGIWVMRAALTALDEAHSSRPAVQIRTT